MGCPICDNKAANCDCTATEREQFDEIESLRAEIIKLRESLAIFVHAHATGNYVRSSHEAAARALLKEVPRD